MARRCPRVPRDRAAPRYIDMHQLLIVTFRWHSPRPWCRRRSHDRREIFAIGTRVDPADWPPITKEAFS